MRAYVFARSNEETESETDSEVGNPCRRHSAQNMTFNRWRGGGALKRGAFLNEAPLNWYVIRSMCRALRRRGAARGARTHGARHATLPSLFPMQWENGVFLFHLSIKTARRAPGRPRGGPRKVSPFLSPRLACLPSARPLTPPRRPAPPRLAPGSGQHVPATHPTRATSATLPLPLPEAAPLSGSLFFQRPAPLNVCAGF